MEFVSGSFLSSRPLTPSNPSDFFSGSNGNSSEALGRPPSPFPPNRQPQMDFNNQPSPLASAPPMMNPQYQPHGGSSVSYSDTSYQTSVPSTSHYITSNVANYGPSCSYSTSGNNMFPSCSSSSNSSNHQYQNSYPSQTMYSGNVDPNYSQYNDSYYYYTGNSSYSNSYQLAQHQQVSNSSPSCNSSTNVEMSCYNSSSSSSGGGSSRDPPRSSSANSSFVSTINSDSVVGLRNNYEYIIDQIDREIIQKECHQSLSSDLSCNVVSRSANFSESLSQPYLPYNNFNGEHNYSSSSSFSATPNNADFFRCQPHQNDEQQHLATQTTHLQQSYPQQQQNPQQQNAQQQQHYSSQTEEQSHYQLHACGRSSMLAFGNHYHKIVYNSLIASLES